MVSPCRVGSGYFFEATHKVLDLEGDDKEGVVVESTARAVHMFLCKLLSWGSGRGKGIVECTGAGGVRWVGVHCGSLLARGCLPGL